MSFFTQVILDAYTDRLDAHLFFYTYATLKSRFSRTNRLINGLTGICGGKISSTYLLNNLKKVMRKIPDPDYDLVVCATTDIHSTPLDQFIPSMRGFIITQKGECRMRPEVHCVKLICANQMGSPLLGVYIYTIINNPAVIEKIGMLELAGGYINMSGLCLYEKYGFSGSPDIFHETCFNDPFNLPMSLDIEYIYGKTPEHQSSVLLEVVNRQRGGMIQKHFISNIQNRTLQSIVGAILNADFIQRHRPSVIRKEYAASIGKYVNYPFIIQHVDIKEITHHGRVDADTLLSYESSIFDLNSPSPAKDNDTDKGKKAKGKKADPKKSAPIPFTSSIPPSSIVTRKKRRIETPPQTRNTSRRLATNTRKTIHHSQHKRT